MPLNEMQDFFPSNVSAIIPRWKYEYNTTNLHSNLGTQSQSHKILITIRHENGVIVLQNE